MGTDWSCGKMKDTFQIVAVVATDWCYYEADRPIARPDKMFTLIDGLIVGLNIYEDDEKIVLAHQYFEEEDKVRHTTVISKSSIIERLEFNFKDGVCITQEHEIEDIEVE